VRFSIELHDIVFGVAEGILNISRRFMRGEPLSLTETEAAECPLLKYDPSHFDCCIAEGLSPPDEQDNDPFAFVGTDQVPKAFAGLLTEERFREITRQPPPLAPPMQLSSASPQQLSSPASKPVPGRIASRRNTGLAPAQCTLIGNLMSQAQAALKKKRTTAAQALVEMAREEEEEWQEEREEPELKRRRR
jgi:hypothetical protein